VNQKLRFVRGRLENIPRGVAYWKGFVQSGGEGSEVGGISGGGGVKVSTEQRH